MTPDHGFRDYRRRRVTVMGLGLFGGGVGAVRFLVERGADVTVTDLRDESQLVEAIAELQATPPATWRLGRHDEGDFLEADLIVVNPAVRRNHPLLLRASAHGVPLTSEMNLFWQHRTGPIVAVTGSNGKSTTSALLHSILQQSADCGTPLPERRSPARSEQLRRRTWLGGNIGRSLLPVVADIHHDDIVVLELSSFQLADLDRLQVSPHLAVVTNFSPNHLDWHETLDAYRRAKQTILRWQTDDDLAVLNADDPDVQHWPSAARRFWFGMCDHGRDGTFLRGAAAVWRCGDHEQEFPLQDWLRLRGRHHLANALAAAAAALALGASLENIRLGLERYAPLPHRLELVGEVAGRTFYNDSLATTPESAVAGIEAFTEPVLVLAGGYDKQVDLSALAQAIARRAKGAALMGQTAPRLSELIRQESEAGVLVSEPLPDFRSSFQWAWDHSSPGDVILLSPGCASYDWFRNFSDRGEQFRRLVDSLRVSRDGNSA